MFCFGGGVILLQWYLRTVPYRTSSANLETARAGWRAGGQFSTREVPRTGPAVLVTRGTWAHLYEGGESGCWANWLRRTFLVVRLRSRGCLPPSRNHAWQLSDASSLTSRQETSFFLQLQTAVFAKLPTLGSDSMAWRQGGRWGRWASRQVGWLVGGAVLPLKVGCCVMPGVDAQRIM